MLPGIVMPRLGELAPPPDATIVFADADSQVATQSVFTFSAKALGTAGANRHIVVMYYSEGAASQILSSATINGVSATLINAASNNRQVRPMIAAVPSGITGDVVLTFGGTRDRVAIAVFACYDLQSTTPTDTDNVASADPTVFSLNINAGGVGIAMVNCKVSTSWAWTNLTEGNDTVWNASADTFSSAALAYAAAQAALAITADNAANHASQIGNYAVSFR